MNYAIESAHAIATDLPTIKVMELEFADRTSLRLKQEQLVKQDNREGIAHQAISITKSEYSKESAIPDNSDVIEMAWLAEFWSKAENISEAELQTLWARVLAMKAQNTRSISIRALHRLMELERSELEQLQRIAAFSIRIISPNQEQAVDCFGIFLNLGQYQGTFSVLKEKNNVLGDYVDKNMGLYDRIGLDSAGVMQSSTGWASEFSVSYSNSITLFIGNKEFLLSDLPKPNERYFSRYGLGSGIGLTKEGWEIVQITNASPDPGYLKVLRAALEESGVKLVAV